MPRQPHVKLGLLDPKPLEHAMAIAADEHRRLVAGLAPLLPRDRHLPATWVAASARRVTSPGLPEGRVEWEIALDLLAQRGLVDELRSEGEVERGVPQAYRWARIATADALQRFASGPAPRSACIVEDCFRPPEQGSRYCRACDRRIRFGARQRTRGDEA